MSDDRVDLALLYDTARGFLATRDDDEVARHVLLSALGSTGARFAVWLHADADGRWRVQGTRGLDANAAGTAESIRPAGEETALLAAARAPVAVASLPERGALAQRARALHAVLCAPLVHDGVLHGALLLGEPLAGGDYAERDRTLVAEVARLVAMATLSTLRATPRVAAGDGAGTRPRARSAAALRARHPELRTLQGDGVAMSELFLEILAVAPHEFPVLVLGETGTGKELVARALHDLGPRAAKPFEAVNCAAIPRDLMPSALFGHERGAFTGAIGAATGAFERAGDGTLFLDEVGDMPLDTQAMLLRVLQEQRFRRVGGDKMLPARARIISATNIDLLHAVEAQRFRADLFYRLQMYVLRLPPLRERREDVPALVAHLLERHRPAAPPRASEALVAALCQRELRGNVRELEALLVGAVVRARGAPLLGPEHLPASVPASRVEAATGMPNVPHAGPGGTPAARAPEPSLAGAPGTYDEMEREYIRTVLQLTGGNKKRAAEIMAIPRTTLAARMRKLGLGGAR